MGKTAIVTGAGQGIGAAIARRLGDDGVDVAIADINVDTGQATTEKIVAETGCRALFVQVDVADRDSVAEMHEHVRAQFGPVDVLVNNAGVAVFKEPLASTDDDWRRCMAIDLEGAWLCSRAVLPDMIERRRGSIINIISNHAFTVIKSTFPYPVAKHGLLGMTRALALEYADRGICVNAISPGYIDTPIADWYFDQFDDPAAARQETEAKQPVGRLGHPEEVAAVASLLASDQARFMIGENIVIDGGVSIRMYE